ncbi:hypothetical protein [Amycolatopsis coloradensis]|uniref:hypothetical protein n=1 Tax=Amycolatopsis coloradensis TaxID=76021 RepID=UPI00244C8734|nr:hypothetical protein [Amycolatopsis coloradensis]
MAAVTGQIGAAKVALRISPGNPENDIVEDDWKEVYSRLLAELHRYERTCTSSTLLTPRRCPTCGRCGQGRSSRTSVPENRPPGGGSP